MRQSYLIRLRPLEPFLFGGEHNFDYGTKRQTPQRYYICSEDRPSQTTLFGTLRYAVLAANDALITAYGDREQIERVRELVGPASFDIAQEEQDFGVIGSISPLFLLHHEGDRIHTLVPLPMNHGFREENPLYVPCTMVEDREALTNRSFTPLYAEDRSLKHIFKGWVSTEEGKIFPYDAILADHLQVGIDSHRTEDIFDQEGGFFKKSKLIFRDKRDAFAFYAEMELTPAAEEAFFSGIPVTMGQGKTPFLLTAELRENRLAEEVRTQFTKMNAGKRPFCYSLSDAYLCEMPEDFFFAETKPFRYLTTDLSRKTHLEQLRRTHTLYRLFSAGGVFYGSVPTGPKHVTTIGLNQFIIIGGTSE